MTDDGLAKRLRTPSSGAFRELRFEAAAAIERLTRLAEQLRYEAETYAAELTTLRNAVQQQGVEDGNRIGGLTAELAKAREALETIRDMPIMRPTEIYEIARAALAKPVEVDRDEVDMEGLDHD